MQRARRRDLLRNRYLKLQQQRVMRIEAGAVASHCGAAINSRHSGVQCEWNFDSVPV